MEDLIYYNSIGLIPGPSESFEDFQRRALYCLNLKQDVLPQIFNANPTESKSLHQAFPKTKSLYGICPDWVSLIYHNEKLAPWHGGAAWIFQMDNDSPTSAVLQLRQSFLHKQSYLGVLKREELIAHELSHIGRMMFDEPKFEEMLAYRSSDSWLSRTLGPLLQSSVESLFFVLSLLLVFFLDIIALLQGGYILFQAVAWLKLLPAALILFAVIRLYRKRKQMDDCFAKLNQLVDNDKAHAILYRLTDQEILLFAKSSIDEIQKYIKQQSELRWQVIRLSYLGT